MLPSLCSSNERLRQTIAAWTTPAMRIPSSECIPIHLCQDYAYACAHTKTLSCTNTHITRAHMRTLSATQIYAQTRNGLDRRPSLTTQHVHAHTLVHSRTQSLTHTHTHARARTHACTHTRTHTHTHARTCMHLQVRFDLHQTFQNPQRVVESQVRRPWPPTHYTRASVPYADYVGHASCR